MARSYGNRTGNFDFDFFLLKLSRNRAGLGCKYAVQSIRIVCFTLWSPLSHNRSLCLKAGMIPQRPKRSRHENHPIQSRQVSEAAFTEDYFFETEIVESEKPGDRRFLSMCLIVCLYSRLRCLQLQPKGKRSFFITFSPLNAKPDLCSKIVSPTISTYGRQLCWSGEHNCMFQILHNSQITN